MKSQTARQNTSSRLRRVKRPDDSELRIGKNVEGSTSMEGLKITTKNLNVDNRPGQDSNRVHTLRVWRVTVSANFLGLHPEDGGSTSLRNTGTHLLDHILTGKFYVAEYKRNTKSSRRGTAQGWFRRTGTLVMEHGYLQTWAVGTRKCEYFKTVCW